MRHFPVTAVLTFVVVLFLTGAPSHVLAIAVDKDRLEDPALEARAHALSKDLRCLVCQNQSIEDSNADLARDLRRIVRERIMEGDTDDQVRQYVVDRYGDWVLLEPPVKQTTLILWLAPFIFLFIGVLGLFLFVRSRKDARVTPQGLTETETARVAQLLAEEELKKD